MIDDARLELFYRDVPAATLDRFRSFLRTHALETLDVGGVQVAYCACGRGRRALLTFCGGHSTPYTAWETVETYERDHRVLVLDISGFGSVAALSEGVNEILEHERVERVVVLGASLAGLIGQIYLKHNLDRVDGIVLMNTVALRPGGDKPLALLLTKLLPQSLLRRTFRKKFRAYFQAALDDPRAEAGARFGLAHLEDVMTNHFTKKKVINLLSVLFEFGREGYTRADLEGWKGRALIIASEDDAGFKDVEWLVESLPNAESHIFPKGLGHLPQLAHREKFEHLIRRFLERLGEARQ